VNILKHPQWLRFLQAKQINVEAAKLGAEIAPPPADNTPFPCVNATTTTTTTTVGPCGTPRPPPSTTTTIVPTLTTQTISTVTPTTQTISTVTPTTQTISTVTPTTQMTSTSSPSSGRTFIYSQTVRSQTKVLDLIVSRHDSLSIDYD
jgi:hypothetical protein